MTSRKSAKKEKRSSHAFRRGMLLGCFMVSGSVIIARAAQLQIVEHDRWLSAAEEQHRQRVELPARRGAIYDRDGVPLAISHEVFQVAVAPREIRDAEEVVHALVDGLEIDERSARRIVESDDVWVVLPGRFDAEQRQKAGTLRGIHYERHFERFYPQGDVGREIIGAVTLDHRALGGIEQQLSDVLDGEPGYSILRKAARGQPQPAISLPVVPPTDGSSVHLTIDLDLQAIADAALGEAISNTGASGGDLVLADPDTGELLAAVSRRVGRSRNLTAITEPYEPGSTLKPFLVATLLAEDRATLGDQVFAELGSWTDGGRTLRDTSPHEWLTLREALEVSSNIAMAKFAGRLSAGQQYSYLRDFGFGTATGIEYPAESSGRLRKPTEWSRMSSSSIAIGYEISVTPLQMVSAYATLANGGRLMEPHLIREIRDADGSVVSRQSPTVLRRVVPEEVARAVSGVLVDVVEEGTATRAALATFDVAGKTGTSRRTEDGRYAAGAYTASFAGFFPADNPQIVIFVKLDEPQGAYYGGLTAAPVTRETLQGILAVRNPGLDGKTLLTTKSDAEGHAAAQPTLTTFAADPSIREIGGPREGRPYVIDLTSPAVAPAEVTAAVVAVPALSGLTMREAAQRAHEAGFRVKVTGSGPVLQTDPAEGTPVSRGDVVTLIGRTE